MVKEITIRNQEQAAQINRVVSHAPYEVWMSTDTTMIDARSLLGLFALVGKKVRVVAEDNVDARAFGKLVNKMG